MPQLRRYSADELYEFATPCIDWDYYSIVEMYEVHGVYEVDALDVLKCFDLDNEDAVVQASRMIDKAATSRLRRHPASGRAVGRQVHGEEFLYEEWIDVEFSNNNPNARSWFFQLLLEYTWGWIVEKNHNVDF